MIHSKQHRGCRIQDPGSRGKHQTKKEIPCTSRGCRVQNSGPWDPWLPVVENSRLFAQHAHSARCAPLGPLRSCVLCSTAALGLLGDLSLAYIIPTRECTHIVDTVHTLWGVYTHCRHCPHAVGGGCGIRNGEIWCGVNLEPILKYRCKLWHKVPGLWHENEQTLRIWASGCWLLVPLDACCCFLMASAWLL